MPTNPDSLQKVDVPERNKEAAATGKRQRANKEQAESLEVDAPERNKEAAATGKHQRANKEEAGERKRQRAKAHYAANKESLARKARLRVAKKRYDKAIEHHRSESFFWTEAHHFAKGRKRELATRLSALRTELRHTEATSEYLNDLFGDQEPTNVLILEVEEDIQALACDIRIVESRYKYYEEREETADRTHSEVQMALHKAKNQYMTMCRDEQTAEEIQTLREIAHRLRDSDEEEAVEAGSPLPPSSDPADQLTYSAASIAKLGAMHSDEERWARGDVPYHRRELFHRNDVIDSMDGVELDSDGQVPIPQADWD